MILFLIFNGKLCMANPGVKRNEIHAMLFIKIFNSAKNIILKLIFS